MYSYKLDDIDFFDEINGIDSISRTISRGWNGTGIDNVLRKRTESSLTFTGEAYQYLEAKFANICESTNIKIYDSIGNIFIEGTIYAFMCTFNITKGECETQIKDTSWSALIIDRANSKFNLRSVKSFDCSASIAKLLPIEVDFFDINGNYIYNNKQGFDILELIQKQIEFLTNGQMTVVSNYLTNNRYGLFDAKALIPLSSTAYFSISFQEVFEQLRKLLGLYLVIDGNQIIIEQESDTKVFNPALTALNIADIPYNSTVSVDEGRQISSVTVGSNEITEDKEDSDEYLALDDRWQEQQYQNCSCASFDKNELDLVTNWVIDSDTILDILINGNFKDKFVLVKLDDADLAKAKRNAIVPTSVFYYNDELRNQNQLDNWATYINSCLYIGRGNDAGFEALGNDDPNAFGQNNLFALGNTACSVLNQYPIYQLDPFNRFTQTSGGITCNVTPVSGEYTSYTVLQQGFYAFEAARTLTWLANNPGDLSISFLIQVWENSTMTTLLYQYISNYAASAVNAGGQTAIDMDVITDALFLDPNNYVTVRFEFVSTMGISGVLYSGFFRSADEVLACLDNLNPTDSYPYKIEFSQDICNAQFEEIEAKKNGVISVAGTDCYISEVTQDIKGGANFVLLSNTPFTKCDPS